MARPPVIIDQRHVQFRRKRAIRVGGDRARAHCHFGRKGFDAAAVGKTRADDTADAAVQASPRDLAFPAECLQRAGKILVRPQPQRIGAARRIAGGGTRGDRPEQFEIGLGVGLRRKHRAIEAEGVDLERLGDHGLLGQDMAAAGPAVGSVHNAWQWKNGARSRWPSVMAPVRSRVMPSGRNVSL